MQPQIAVVIPYYQTEPGILARAIESIAAQTHRGPIQVIVVDDASPLPAAAQLHELALPPSVSVEIVQRPNGGPAAARNTGLSRVSHGARHVAFLDSDDRWSPEHLARASLALSQGYDFYFADLLQLDQSVGAFARGGKIMASEHTPLAQGEELHAYRGDMFDQIIRGNVIGTSTVVFDRSRFPSIRFREEYYSAGEDYLCWMDFAQAGARFAFSARCEATYGRGVNVYSGARFGTAKHLERVHNEFKYRHATARLHRVTPEQKRFLEAKKAELREDFTRDLLHMLRHGQLPVRILARQFMLDPLLAAEPFRLVARQVLHRPAS